MSRSINGKSNRGGRISFAALLLLCFANRASAFEGGNVFVARPKLSQVTAPVETQSKDQAKPTDQSVCQDALKLYLTVSTATYTSQRTTEVLLETIYRHETMKRLVMIATAAGCEMRPFIDEEIRRNER